MAMPAITISYPPEKSRVLTRRIFDRLTNHYGRDSVFRDIDSIPPGADFREFINVILDESDIVLAVVGPRWLGARAGQTRLSDEADLVRVEIETALRKSKPLIPVMVQRATMPRVALLPDTLRDFAYKNGVPPMSSRPIIWPERAACRHSSGVSEMALLRHSPYSPSE